METIGEQRGRHGLQLLSLLGALYCLANATGAELFCGTRGSEIYAGYGLFGLSSPTLTVLTVLSSMR